MARAGVNYIHVVKAAEAIKERGLEPTVDRVREQLGTGSKSTIAPLLKQWKAQNTVASDVSGLPSDLVEIVRSLYERIQQDAELKIEEISSSLNQTVSHLQQQLLTAQQHNLLLDEQNNALVLLNQTTIDELEILRAQEIKHEAHAVNNASIITGLKDTVKEAKVENRAATARLEHYQSQVAQERQSSRQQQQQLTQQLQDQIKQLSIQNSELSSKLHDQQQLSNGKDREFYKLASEKQQLENTLATTSTTVDELHAKIVVSVEAYQQLNVKHESIKGDHDKAIANHLSVVSELERLNKNLEDKQSQLITLQDKLFLLDDNYKLALQEKASIAGQFKQLQKSL
jgi:chromosome segregation ATPase